MRIHVLTNYRNTNGVHIEAGEYDGDDKALRNLAGYLLQTGHAVRLDEPEPEPEPVAPVDDEHEALVAEYEALTGDKPAWNIKTETLRAKIDELHN